MMCDVVWRLYRPHVLGCEKPRPKPWSAEHSGKNPLRRVPIFEDAKSEVASFYDVREYIRAWAEWREEGGAAGRPKIGDFRLKPGE